MLTFIRALFTELWVFQLICILYFSQFLELQDGLLIGWSSLMIHKTISTDLVKTMLAMEKDSSLKLMIENLIILTSKQFLQKEIKGDKLLKSIKTDLNKKYPIF